MSDRVVVMRERRHRRRSCPRAGLTAERIAHLMTGARQRGRSGMRRELGMFVALVLLCLGLWATNHDFLGASNVLNTTRQVSMLGVFAIGISFVIITGGIDLSIGSVIGLTGVLIAKLSGQYYPDNPAAGGLGHSLWIGIPVALGVAALVGLAQGLLDHPPQPPALHRHPRRHAAAPRRVPDDRPGRHPQPRRRASRAARQRRAARVRGQPAPALSAADPAGRRRPGAAYLLHFTVFGRYVYAIGGNRDAAEYSGVPVRRVETLTYVISAFSGGVAGVCYAAYIGQMSQQVGIAYELYAIAAAVLGGRVAARRRGHRAWARSSARASCG